MKRLGVLTSLVLLVGCGDGAITNYDIGSATGGEDGGDVPGDPTEPGDDTPDTGDPDPGDPPSDDPPDEEPAPDDPPDEEPPPGDPPPDDPPDEEPPPSTLAAGTSIRDVVVYQTVAVPVIERGQLIAPSQRNAPLVAGADAVFGIAVDVAGGFTARQVEAVVTLGSQQYSETLNLSRSTGSLPNDGYTVAVPGSALAAGGQFSVALREVGDTTYQGSTDGAELPAQALGVESSNGPLELVIVPFRYNADGSGRLPPVDANTIEAYRRDFRAMFPVADVNITVRQTVPYNAAITGRTGWQEWLEYLTDLRRTDGVASNVFYYGVAAPAPDFRSYCVNGCTAGLGWVPGPTNSFLFSSVGVSFPNNPSIAVGLHEVGHTLGRSHSPCGGVSGADPAYPYQGGSIGVWGYDSDANQLIDPSVGTDIMGYCRNQWISDFTYDAIFERISRVNGFNLTGANAPRTYRVGRVDENGAVTWRPAVTLDRAAVGGDRAVALFDSSGAPIGEVEAHFFAYDHLPGGMLLVPVEASFAAPATIEISGLGQLEW